LRDALPFNDPAELLQQIAQLESDSQELRTVKLLQESTMASLGKLWPLQSIQDLPAAANFITETLLESKKVAQLEDLTQIPSRIAAYQSEIRELKAHLATAAELMTRILSRIFKRNVTASFPLDSALSAKIAKGFDDYVDTTEALQANVEALLKEARTLGYAGISCVDAAVFLAEELCRKKEQEHLEQMVLQMKQLREDKDRERQVSDQRNKANTQKLAELRQSKASLAEQAAAKQAELLDQIEQLQREARDSEAKIDQLQRVRDELVRLSANEVYDHEILRKLLSSTEKAKLKLWMN
jgi:hypothetical protein